MSNKPPLQAILIAPIPEMRSKVISGQKKITIREGHRDYQIGQVMLCCHLEPWAVMAEIIEVRHCLLDQVTDEELQADGFVDRRGLLCGLRRFYPQLSFGSPVTIIRWNNVSGALVDHFNANNHK